MNSDVKLYLKLFLFWAIIFGIGTLLFDFIDGREFSFWGFLFRVLFYGIGMSLLLGSLHIFYIEEIIGVEKITADDLGVKQIRIVKSDINRQELINKLKKDPIIGKMKLALTEDEISLKSNSTWKSWGECITIKVKQVADHMNEYEISSRPKLKATLVDFGKGLLNVTRIEKLIKNVA